jgi:CcmD family protein
MWKDPAISPAESAAPAGSTSAAPTGTLSVEGRSAAFRGVEGAEVYRGETLLVIAYIVLWVILFAWIALIWKKQTSLHSRLDELDRSIDRAIQAKKPGDAPKE